MANPVGRPAKTKKEAIERNEFEKLCKMQIDIEDIADFFGVSESYMYKWIKETYDRPFGEVQKSFNAKGRVRLLEIQYKLAEKNVPMAIWLGRNVLGQTDKVEQDTTVKVNFINTMPKGDMDLVKEEKKDDVLDEEE